MRLEQAALMKPLMCLCGHMNWEHQRWHHGGGKEYGGFVCERCTCKDFQIAHYHSFARWDAQGQQMCHCGCRMDRSVREEIEA